VSGPCGLFKRNTAPDSAVARTSRLVRNENWWQATNVARSIRYGARIGRGPKRRCEMVTEPDFFESYRK
jgi:hypothetical protein